MQNAKSIGIQYIRAESSKKQGTSARMKKYINNGYYGENMNGNWLLTKSSKVMVTLANSNGEKTFNMRKDILERYEKSRLSYSLVEKFIDDVENEKITFEMDEECKTYYVK